MTFERPWVLFGAALAAVVVAVLVERARRGQTRAALTYSSLAFAREAIGRARMQERWLLATWMLAWILFAMAGARPIVRLSVPTRNAYAVLCIDTSGSMASTDLRPSRWDAALAAARSFARALPPGTHIGVVAFATSAMVLQPPTTERSQVLAALDELPRPGGATAIGDALRAAATMLPSRGRRVVVLVTDGVNNTGSDPLETAQWLGAHRIVVDTVGIGTPSGSVIPGTGGEIATIDPDALRAYAAATGGLFVEVSDAAKLRAALEHLGTLAGTEKRPIALGVPLAIAASALAMASALLGFLWGRYP